MPAHPSNHVEAAFAIQGPDVDLELVTARLGIQPTAVARAGERLPWAPILRKASRWELQSGLAPELEMEDHVAALMDALAGAQQAIQELPSHWDRVISFMIRVKDPASAPAIYLDAGLIGRMAALNCVLDVDLYIEQ